MGVHQLLRKRPWMDFGKRNTDVKYQKWYRWRSQVQITLGCLILLWITRVIWMRLSCSTHPCLFHFKRENCSVHINLIHMNLLICQVWYRWHSHVQITLGWLIVKVKARSVHINLVKYQGQFRWLGHVQTTLGRLIWLCYQLHFLRPRPLNSQRSCIFAI